MAKLTISRIITVNNSEVDTTNTEIKIIIITKMEITSQDRTKKISTSITKIKEIIKTDKIYTIKNKLKIRLTSPKEAVRIVRVIILQNLDRGMRNLSMTIKRKSNIQNQ